MLDQSIILRYPYLVFPHFLPYLCMYNGPYTRPYKTPKFDFLSGHYIYFLWLRILPRYRLIAIGWPSKFLSALKSYCSRLSAVMLSYDSRSTNTTGSQKKMVEGPVKHLPHVHTITQIWVGAAAYQLGNTSSRKITEVKHSWARLVLGWDTVQVLPECCC